MFTHAQCRVHFIHHCESITNSLKTNEFLKSLVFNKFCQAQPQLNLTSTTTEAEVSLISI